MRRLVIILLACVGLAMSVGQHAVSQAQDVSLPPTVQSIVDSYPASLRVGLHIEDAQGKFITSLRSTTPFASASAIKTALLIELFDQYATELDLSPPALAAFMEDTHPAVVHFTPAQRAEIRKGLGGASVRRIGKVMMGTESASNLVYNAAANMTIALLGSPTACTERIHKRSSDLQGMTVRRYMLAPRDQPGDNMATPASLATVWRWLANNAVPDVHADTQRAIEDAILTSSKRHGVSGAHRYKDGALDSWPRTRVYAGCVNVAGLSRAYAVMLEQPMSDSNDPRVPNEPLESLGLRLTATALEKATP
jgi:hypothetical protein